MAKEMKKKEEHRKEATPKKWTKHGKRKRREEKMKQRSLRSMIHLRKMWVLKSVPLSIIKAMKESF